MLHLLNTKMIREAGLNIKRPPFLALALAPASSSTFLYSVQKGLYNEAMQSKLCQSLTNHQGVNTLGKNKQLAKMQKYKKVKKTEKSQVIS